MTISFAVNRLALLCQQNPEELGNPIRHFTREAVFARRKQPLVNQGGGMPTGALVFLLCFDLDIPDSFPPRNALYQSFRTSRPAAEYAHGDECWTMVPLITSFVPDRC